MPNLEYLIEHELVPQVKRLADAVERLVEVITVPVYVTTLKDKKCPECGAREGLDYHAFHCSRPEDKKKKRHFIGEDP